MNPQVVRELQRNTATPVRDWRKGFGVLSLMVSAASGVALILFGIPDKDFKGRDHVFSGIQRAFKAKRDEFFGVPVRTSSSSSSKSEPANTATQQS